LSPQGYDIAKLIDDLTVNSSRADKVTRSAIAHLDPDVCESSISSRHQDWKGIFGQCGSAQGHLRNQNVGKGDVFLFFGLFQRVELAQGRYRFVKGSKPMHLIWGWLQIGEIIEVNSTNKNNYTWAAYHPHFYMGSAVNNTIYLASDFLHLNGEQAGKIKGYGAIEKYSELQQLTIPDSRHLTDWRLPAWMYREYQPCPLSYNADKPWTLTDGFARLSTYSRGQEYVMDCKGYPEANDWIRELIAKHD
jgi:hypothetical protein